MEQDFDVIRQSPLFCDISEGELRQALGALSARRRDFLKGAFILRAGESVSSLCLVLSGRVHIVKEDYWGNRHIVIAVSPGQVFAEAFACAEGVVLGVSAVAAEKTSVLFLDVQKLLGAFPCDRAFHARMTQNLMSLLAHKNLVMNEKMTHLSKRTTREKLLSYLSTEAERSGSASFTIAFNRQQLADYLSVDRSAMSNELGKMRDEKLLAFDRNHFTLL